MPVTVPGRLRARRLDRPSATSKCEREPDLQPHGATSEDPRADRSG